MRKYLNMHLLLESYADVETCTKLNNLAHAIAKEAGLPNGTAIVIQDRKILFRFWIKRDGHSISLAATISSRANNASEIDFAVEIFGVNNVMSVRDAAEFRKELDLIVDNALAVHRAFDRNFKSFQQIIAHAEKLW